MDPQHGMGLIPSFAIGVTLQKPLKVLSTYNQLADTFNEALIKTQSYSTACNYCKKQYCDYRVQKNSSEV